MVPPTHGFRRPCALVAAAALAAVVVVLMAGPCWAAPGWRRPPPDVLIVEAPPEANLTQPAEVTAPTPEQARHIMMQKVLRGLGMTKMPDVARMNVSQEEYDNKFAVYLDAVAQGRKRHRKYYSEYRRGDRRAPPWVVNPWLPTRRRHFVLTAELDDDLGRNRRSLELNDSHSVAALHLPMRLPDRRLRHRDATLSRATLRLLITAPLSVADKGVRVRLYRPAAHPGTAPALIAERRVTFPIRGPHLVARWVSLDVTSAMSDWLRNAHSNTGLLIECEDCSFQAGPSAAARPVVDVLMNVRGHGRFRRSYDPMSPRKRGRTDCRRGGEKCCRHQMEVVFHELKGFEFILQPKKFDAGFCRGRCPPRFNPAHHHAVLQSLIWKQDRKLAPKPCCAPNKLKSLEILHLDEDDPTRLKVSHWEDMEVLECACS